MSIEYKWRASVKNKSYFFAFWLQIKKTELNEEFEQTLPSLVNETVQKILSGNKFSFGYKKLFC